MGFNIKYLLVIFFLTGCLKKPAELAVNDGDPVNIADVEDSLALGFGNIDPLQMQKDEFVAEAQTQQIYDLPERIVTQAGTSVQKREVLSDRVNYTFLQQLVEYDANQNQKSSVSQRKLTVLTGGAQTMAGSQHPSIRFCRSLFSSSVEQDSATTNENKQQKVREKIKSNLLTSFADRSSPLSIENFCSLALACENVGQCFNFESSVGYEAPPAPVVQSPNCQNLPNCSLKVVTTKFAFVFTDTDSQGNEIRNKILYTIKLSPDAPYLARLLSQCRQGIVPIDKTTKVYATICDKVTNFNFGQ